MGTQPQSQAYSLFLGAGTPELAAQIIYSLIKVTVQSPNLARCLLLNSSAKQKWDTASRFLLSQVIQMVGPQTD